MAYCSFPGTERHAPEYIAFFHVLSQKECYALVKGRYDIEQRYKLTDTSLPPLYRLDFEVEGDEGKYEALDMG